MNRDLLLLRPLARLDDYSLLVLRLLTGGFLCWEMWFNISDSDTMQQVIAYFAANGFAYPSLFAPLSAWAQFVIGIMLILGILTRWAGILLAFNFIVGLIMVDGAHGVRASWPATALIAIGLLIATHGAGRFSLDSTLLGSDDDGRTAAVTPARHRE